jgi:hypothetical protein
MNDRWSTLDHEALQFISERTGFHPEAHSKSRSVSYYEFQLITPDNGLLYAGLYLLLHQARLRAGRLRIQGESGIFTCHTPCLKALHSFWKTLQTEETKRSDRFNAVSIFPSFHLLITQLHRMSENNPLDLLDVDVTANGEPAALIFLSSQANLMFVLSKDQYDCYRKLPN